MTSPTDDDPNATVDRLEAEIADLKDSIGDLTVLYQRAGGRLRTIVEDDVLAIGSAKEESERLLTVIRGGALFGRYQSDADHHMRQANRWRIAATMVLMLVPIGLLAAIKFLSVSDTQLLVIATTAVAIFLYFSIESHNHRRREFDRRRISLRMAAIESFLTQRLADETTRVQAQGVMDEFIKKHFIEPELDDNSLAYLSPRNSFLTIVHRPKAQEPTPDQGGSQ